ncbi:hypothetical protein [Rhizobium sp. 2MFCol3.1]|uniref:hypothetical protein n=1 Tax=Rhizobium sp. 2MFCol3.1 TaxID=1246459 RepID=UPI000369F809|nr:hypothetical protein [Rhizobium sp. 2MFCol3.1]
MISDFTEEQQKMVAAGDRLDAALRLHNLLQERTGPQKGPSIEECKDIVELIIARVEQVGT